MSHPQGLNLLASVGAMVTNSHLVYTSGKHGDSYINKDALYPHTRITSQLCLLLAKAFEKDDVDAVLAPAIGAIILSQWTAYHLSKIKDQEVFGVYAEKASEGNAFVIKRGYDKLIAEKSILVVEDVLTTGGSVNRVIRSALDLGAHIAGVAALCNRGGIRAQDLETAPRLFSLIDLTLNVWDENECPLCQQGIAINTDLGKGREFLEKKR